MRYVNHNFFSNFLGGVNSNDAELTIDLWVNEVSNLIIDNTDEIISLLNKTGVKSDKTDSYEQLSEKIIDNINSNTLLNKGISFMIATENGITPNKKKDWEKIVASISNKYTNLFKSILGNEKLKASLKDDLMQHIKTKSETTKSGDKKVVFKSDTLAAKKSRNKKIALYVIGGIAVVSLIYYLMNVYKKGDVTSFEHGGQLPVNPQIPSNPIQSLPTSVPV